MLRVRLRLRPRLSSCRAPFGGPHGMRGTKGFFSTRRKLAAPPVAAAAFRIERGLWMHNYRSSKLLGCPRLLSATASKPEGGEADSKVENKEKEKEPQYWRDDYKTDHDMDDLYKKQVLLHEKESKTTILQRALDGSKNAIIAIGNLIISLSKGTLTLIMNPTKIPGFLADTWKTIKHEAYHYWLGFKLMGKNIGTAIGILHTALQGKRLTRRERRMLRLTAVDIFRLVPFSIFILIPFMEFLLPVALRLFPDMLPSSFKQKHEREDKMKKELQARLQMASFLQETVQDLIQKNLSDHEMKDDISTLLDSVRKGSRISNEQIVKVAKVFSDELTLENMHRPQLVSLCQYMGIRPFGSNTHLRLVLSEKMAKLKEDDELIEKEGVTTLTIGELRVACQERGMRTVGLTTAGYRQNLRQWLDLSLNQKVPLSLLILSRAFTILETRSPSRPEEVLRTTLSAMDDEFVEEVLVGAGVESDTATKLEVLERQKEMIEEESEERAVRDERRRKIAEAKEAEAKEREEAQVEASEEAEIAKEKQLAEEAIGDIAAADQDEPTVLISDKVLEEAVEDLEALVEGQAVEEERETLEALKKEIEVTKDEVEEKEEEIAVAAEQQVVQVELGVDAEQEKQQKQQQAQVEAAAVSHDVVSSSVAEEHSQLEAAERKKQSSVVGAESQSQSQGEKETGEETERDKIRPLAETIQEFAGRAKDGIQDVMGDEMTENQRQKMDALLFTQNIANRLTSRVEAMVMNIEKRIDDAELEMEKLNVLDTDGDGLITKAELVEAIKDVLKEHNTDAEAQAIAREVLSRAGDSFEIGVSVKELIALAHELRAKNFEKSEKKSREKEESDENTGAEDQKEAS